MKTELRFSSFQIAIVVLITLVVVATAFAYEIYYLLFLPAFFFIALGFFFQPDLLFYFLAFITPLSINPSDVELGKLSVSLPSEPVAVILVMLFCVLLLTTNKVDKKFLLHPVSFIVYLYFTWLFVSCLFSVDKLVSIKFIIAKTWFIVPCYFLAGVFFRENKSIVKYLSLFILGLLIVSAYNIIHLSTHGFEDRPSQWTMQPFFKDHAILGATIAIVIPVCLGLLKLTGKDVLRKLFFICAFLVLVTCLVITYSRAAWVSVIPAILLYFAFLLKIRFRWLFMIFILVMTYLFTNMDSIILDLERNKVSGSNDLVENAESISNISTDPSNLERINRWACAIEMWKEKPWVGWGPGTYMFEYAPFQLRRNYTAISTNFGDVGNAHSEYLGPLAETGLPGLLIFLGLFIATVYFAFRAYSKSIVRFEKIIISSSACALITYFIHGFLNNYLDTDKASNIFWPLIAILVVMDLRNKSRINSTEELSKH